MNYDYIHNYSEDEFEDIQLNFQYIWKVQSVKFMMNK